MGVERAVTRWYIHRQLRLNNLPVQATSPVNDAVPEADRVRDDDDQQDTEHHMAVHLGPCPKPMMG